jgi:hypothetical protein
VLSCVNAPNAPPYAYKECCLVKHRGFVILPFISLSVSISFPFHFLLSVYCSSRAIEQSRYTTKLTGKREYISDFELKTGLLLPVSTYRYWDCSVSGIKSAFLGVKTIKHSIFLTSDQISYKSHEKARYLKRIKGPGKGNKSKRLDSRVSCMTARKPRTAGRGSARLCAFLLLLGNMTRQVLATG